MTIPELLAILGVGAAGGGYGVGALNKMNEADYREAPDTSPMGAAGKVAAPYAVIGGGTGAALANMLEVPGSPGRAGRLAKGAGVGALASGIFGGTVGGMYGLGKRDEEARRRALAEQQPMYSNPLA